MQRVGMAAQLCHGTLRLPKDCETTLREEAEAYGIGLWLRSRMILALFRSGGRYAFACIDAMAILPAPSGPP